MKQKDKIRLDLALKNLGFVETREKAAALVMAGKVLVNEQKVEKPGHSISSRAKIRILGEPMPFVSRGGLKLEQALEEFSVSVQGFTVLDIGASTGGFTDCLLQKGAKKVYAVDVGTSQLHRSLVTNPHVVDLSKTNFRYIESALIPEPIDLAVIDVSFISLSKIFPKLSEFCRPGGQVIALFKPQFEAGKKEVGKGGVIREESKKLEALQRLIQDAEITGFRFLRQTASKTHGKKKGNIELLTLWEKI